MPRRKQIYKITYPNGKVYVGTVAIGNYHDSGNTHMIRAPLGILAAFFDRLGRYEPAAISAGFAVTSPVAALPAMADFGTATAHLRTVLGEATYESLASKGAAMTATAMATYAYDQIDQARAELEAVSKQTSFESLKTSCQRWHDMTDIVDQQ